MTSTEKAIRDYCGHCADWWPSASQVQAMLALAQPEQDAFKAAYIEAMIASNEAGFAGMTAAETIRELSRMVSEQLKPHTT